MSRADALIRSQLGESELDYSGDAESKSWLSQYQPHEVHRHHGPHPSHTGNEPPHPQVGMLTLHTGGEHGPENVKPEDFAELLHGYDDGGASPGDNGVASLRSLGISMDYQGMLGEAAKAEKPVISRSYKSFGIANSAKSEKGQEKGWLNGIMYLAPAGFGGTPNYCSHASPGCKHACLFQSGRLGMGKGKAQVAKTMDFAHDRENFNDRLSADIGKAHEFSQKKGFKLAVRLNGTSDIPWEKQGIMEKHPKVKFYDYTKNHYRMHAYLDGRMPKNYHLTYSVSETPESHAHAQAILDRGGNVAVPFDIPPARGGRPGGKLPKTWKGRKVIDGDKSDLRFLDKHKGVWVGLRAKSKTWKIPGAPESDHGFIVKNPHLEP